MALRPELGGELASHETSAPRVIGALAGMCIVAGSMFGIGIFIGPPEVAKAVDSPTVLLLIWLVAGLLALCGAVACGELGAMMPRAGGDYIFQRAAMGPSVAFASGWLLAIGVFGGSVASMTVALFEYQVGPLLDVDLTKPLFAPVEMLDWGFTITTAQLAAAALTALLAAINIVGTRLSAGLQTVMTLLPISVAALLAVYALANVPPAAAATDAAASSIRSLTLTGLVLAYLPVYFAYSGWNVIIYVAGEVKNPARTIPRSLLGGTGVVTAFYVLLSAAFVHVLGMNGLRSTGEAGTAAAMAIAGDRGRVGFLVLMIAALFTATNGTVLTGARVAFAMGRAGAFWRGAGALHPKFHTPSRALIFQAACSITLIFSGAFEELLALASLAMVVTGSLNVVALFVLRWRQPDLDRPYRATGYPLLPLLYLGSNLVVIVVMVWRALHPEAADRRAWYPLLGLAILAVVWLTHWVVSRRTGQPAKPR